MVMAHTRGDWLTAQVAARAEARLEADGVAVDLLDLHAEDFDPRMTRADEPAWNRDKTYSAEVVAHMRRIDTADLIVVVFPVLVVRAAGHPQGWIDPVWNYRFAYARSTAPLARKRMVWLGLAGPAGPRLRLQRRPRCWGGERLFQGVGPHRLRPAAGPAHRPGHCRVFPSVAQLSVRQWISMCV
jgi:putative NADPH-quinone reductase